MKTVALNQPCSRFFDSPQGTMQSSNHRLRDMEQHHPLLSAGADVETGSLAAGVMVGGPHSGHTSSNRTLWFIQDSCGMVCATMTWFLVLYAEFVVNFVMLLPAKSFWYSLLNGATFNSLAVLALASHLRTMLTDPVRRFNTLAAAQQCVKMNYVESNL